MIEYLRTENWILREKLGQKRILLNDSQERRLFDGEVGIVDVACREAHVLAVPGSGKEVRQGGVVRVARPGVRCLVLVEPQLAARRLGGRKV